jgi:hypothetical protein
MSDARKLLLNPRKTWCLPGDCTFPDCACSDKSEVVVAPAPKVKEIPASREGLACCADCGRYTELPLPTGWLWDSDEDFWAWCPTCNPHQLSV